MNILRTAIFFILASLAAAGQRGSDITIASPSNGTVVAPGQTINVVVTSRITLQGAIVLGESPIQDSDFQTASPYLCTVQIPQETRPRKYTLTAYGTVVPGQNIISEPIQIRVEKPESISQMTVEPATIRFNFVGESLPLQVLGHFSDGTDYDVTESTKTTFRSSDPSVAIDPDGIATAIGPGKTTLIVSYGGLAAEVLVSVPASLPGDLNGDERIDDDDLGILRRALNSNAAAPNDARDLNHDGKIDENDVEIMKNLIGEQNDKNKRRDQDRRKQEKAMGNSH